MACSYSLDKRDKAADINRLDRPPRRNRHRFRNAGMLENRMASARLADVDAMRGGHRLKAPDPPVARVCPHLVERLVGARHPVSALVGKMVSAAVPRKQALDGLTWIATSGRSPYPSSHCRGVGRRSQKGWPADLHRGRSQRR